MTSPLPPAALSPLVAKRDARGQLGQSRVGERKRKLACSLRHASRERGGIRRGSHSHLRGHATPSGLDRRCRGTAAEPTLLDNPGARISSRNSAANGTTSISLRVRSSPACKTSQSSAALPTVNKMSGKTVFVTGAAGFIGSHTVIELLRAGYRVIGIDNFANAVPGENGQAASLERAQELTGRTMTFYQCDLLEKASLARIFDKHKIDFVIHFAAMKAVGESMQKPLFYYKNNIVSTINLLEVRACVHVSTPLAQKSAQTIHSYKEDKSNALQIVSGILCISFAPMFQHLTKLPIFMQQWNIIALRYFNPLGAHPSGKIGEDPIRAFTNLMPVIGEVALGKRTELAVLGGDYDTEDGTSVRDFIHVMDLATGHVAALERLEQNPRYKVYNLGTGKGYTVLQLIDAFEKVTGKKIPYKIHDRRLGDIPAIWGDCSLAEKELHWKAQHGIERMCMCNFHN
ncbi:hypothetical protein HPB49_015082 [Dermacentor silvarum]|uniref:Uncharacterized protein n=1 Tax=Dermacentor silvarum TaxID=543639 RepID=A0ACB8DJK2_DERSI|nr:hypothetical protein HPB49_015082 [Dermacentor silvarum]